MARLKWEMPACPGIYCIEHVASGRRYIGSTRNLRKRLREHRLTLRRGTHFAPYLQRAWNKHGEDAFAFRALETCLDSALMLIAREQHWIDKCKGKLYNTRPAAEQFSSEWARSEEAKPFFREHAEKVSRSWLRREAVEVACAECGKPFLSKAPEGCRAKYCSRNCSMKEEARQGKRHRVATCEHCRSEFRTDRYGKSRFCSSRCKNRAASGIKESDVAPIIARIVSGETIGGIARSIGVPVSTIYNVGTRRTFGDVAITPELEALRADYFSESGKAARRIRSGLSPADIPAILGRLAAGETHGSIAKDYGVCRGTIGNLAAGKIRRWCEFLASPSAPPGTP